MCVTVFVNIYMYMFECVCVCVRMCACVSHRCNVWYTYRETVCTHIERARERDR